MLTFVVFSVVLFIYNKVVFAIFLLGSILYGGWMALFLQRRKVLDYELFEQQAINNNRTYEFITSMQEIKLQDCEQRKRKEWEETQVNLFRVQQKSLKLQQTQEAGSIFINEVKNIVVTVVAATAVIQGHMTLGMMLAVQYIIGQRKDHAHPIDAGLLPGAGRKNHHRRYRHQSAQQEMVAQAVWRGDAGGRHLLGKHRAQHSRG